MARKTILLNEEQAAKFKLLGGSTWLKKVIYSKEFNDDYDYRNVCVFLNDDDMLKAQSINHFNARIRSALDKINKFE